MTNKEWAEHNQIDLCASMEEVIEKSDALCVLAPDNVETHERLSKLPLMSGKPTFIDKTFAPDKKTAERIFALAQRYNTPCFSTSALRYAAEYQNLDYNNIAAINSIGGGKFDIYIVHQIEPLVMMLNCKALRVMAVGNDSVPAFVIEFENDLRATISCFTPGCPFQMTISFANGECKVLDVKSDVFNALMLELIKFYKTGVIPVPHSQTLDIMAIRDACLNAHSRKDNWTEV